MFDDRVGFVVALAFGALATTAGAGDDAASDARVAFFEERVRPVLAETCGECHGHDGVPRAGLRLTHRETLLHGGASGPAAVPGDPDASLLLRALSYEDPELQMPPDGRLPDDVLADIETWIRDGMTWPDDGRAPIAIEGFDLDARRNAHWCWQPVVAHEPPPSDDARWDASTIDRFVHANLVDLALEPAAPASPAAWLRRVTIDLHGVPPTPEALAAFTASPSRERRAEVVDALLASPRFGQRWASHWLDLVRYAETLGHEFDFEIHGAWRYRDYVVRALNGDVPYDAFIREHLAGDLLETPRRGPDGTNESVLATAFHWLGEQTHSPVDVRAHGADVIANQIDVTSKAFTGVTVACARCHDHMFDAISQADYYALAGVLASTRRVHRPVDDPRPHAEARAALATAADAWRAELADAARDARPKRDAPLWIDVEPELRDGDVALPMPTPADAHGWTWLGQATGAPWAEVGALSYADAPWLHTTPAIDTALCGRRGEVGVRSRDVELRARHLHVLAAGAQTRLNVVVDGFKVIRDPIYGRLTRVIGNTEPHWISIDLGAWIDDDHPHRAFLELLDLSAPDPGTPHGLPHDGAGWARVFAVVFSDDAEPPTRRVLDPTPVGETAWTEALDAFVARKPDADAMRLLARTGIARPSPVQRDEEAEPVALPPAEAAWRALADALPSPTWALAAADGDGFDHPLYVRGSSSVPADPVPRGFLTALGFDDTPARGSGRLAVADAIASPDNPLTARVAVNRAWHHLFGRGLVATPDNLGVLGSPPSHPELLDALAAGFVDDGWSLKRLVRRVVLSETYGMSTRAAPRTADRAREVDPDNVALHRQNVRRLDAEALRDSLLAVADALDDDLGGPPVPTHLTEHMTGRGRPGASGPLDGDGRRTIYQAVRRNFLSPMQSAFDRPAPFSCVGRRNVTNVPAQALFLLNDPFVELTARRAAESLVASFDARDARLDALFLRALARRPNDAERGVLGEHLDALAAEEREDVERWASIAHVVVNMKPFLFVGADDTRIEDAR